MLKGFTGFGLDVDCVKMNVRKLVWKRLVKLILFTYMALNIFACSFANKMIFPYQGKTSYDENLAGLEMLDAGEGVKIALRKSAAVPQPQEKFIVLFFHGNFEDIGTQDFTAQKLAPLGMNIYGMDYRGYGLSTGKPNEKNCYRDSQLAYDELLKKGYKPEQIIIWGRSVGSGVATELATKNKAKALVLESPFVSAYRVMTKYPLVPFDKFKSLSKMRQVEMPVFFIHGDSDTLIPPWHSEKLMHKHEGKNRRVLIKGAGHNDVWAHDTSVMLQELKQFLEE